MILIPERTLELHYDASERELIRRLEKELSTLDDANTARKIGYEALRLHWDNEADWIQNTHFIRAGTGLIPLRWNNPQRKLYELIAYCRAEGRPIEIIILKARKMGFTTQIASWSYEQSDRRPNTAAALISYNDKHVGWVGGMIATIQSNMPCARKFRLNNAEDGMVFETPHDAVIVPITGGSENVGRGYTFNNMHISELPHWVSQEASLLSAMNASVFTFTAAQPTPDDSIIHESTAKGAFGPFYRMWRAAERGDQDNTLLPFFAPWFWDERYVGRFHSEDHRRKFMSTLEPQDTEYGEKFGLSPERMLWMVNQRMRACGGNRKRFNQEFPADAKMAFIASGDTAFDQDRLAVLAEISKPPQWYGTVALT